MKCENCGKYEANYHYTSNINGKVTEKHLCSECAGKLGEQENLFQFDDMLESVFSDMFDGFFSRRAQRLSPWGSFGFSMPTLMMPRFEVRLAEDTAAPETAEKEAKSEAKTQEDPEMKKRRELNMLRHQMKMAAKNEEYEKAAELRDKLRELERAE